MALSIFVAGHHGMVGSAIVRQLSQKDNVKLIFASKEELDLRDNSSVYSFLNVHKPDHVYVAAAKVGGIYANNKFPADFIFDNLVIQTNLIKGSYEAGVQKLLFLGSSCIYPKMSNQPIKEEYLLSDKLESTNEPYAIAKIAGIKMCESFNRQYGVDYRSAMPTNLYGINDNFHPLNSHVIPAMIYRFHKAKIENANEVIVWGTGNPMREFLHVDDLASACIFIMNLPKNRFYSNISSPTCSHINVGSGKDISIKELAKIISKVVGFKGNIKFDNTKPDGVQKKLLDVSRLNTLGWKPSFNFEDGLYNTYQWFLNNFDSLRN